MVKEKIKSVPSYVINSAMSFYKRYHPHFQIKTVTHNEWKHSKKTKLYCSNWYVAVIYNIFRLMAHFEINPIPVSILWEPQEGWISDIRKKENCFKDRTCIAKESKIFHLHCQFSVLKRKEKQIKEKKKCTRHRWWRMYPCTLWLLIINYSNLKFIY